MTPFIALKIGNRLAIVKIVKNHTCAYVVLYFLIIREYVERLGDLDLVLVHMEIKDHKFLDLIYKTSIEKFRIQFIRPFP